MTDYDYDAPMRSVACANPQCTRGVEGRPAVFVPSRRWSLYCSKPCRMQAAGRRRRGAEPEVPT